MSSCSLCHPWPLHCQGEGAWKVKAVQKHPPRAQPGEQGRGEGGPGDVSFFQEERKTSFLSNSPMDPKQCKWTGEDEQQSLFYLSFLSLWVSVLLLHRAAKALTPSRDFFCLWWDGGNQTEPRQVGIVARGGRQRERGSPGRGVALAGLPAMWGVCHSRAFSWEREKEKGMEFKGVSALL